MPEPQGDAPVAPNHGTESYGLKGVKVGTSASAFDQTDNRQSLESSAQRLTSISKEAKSG